MRNCFILFYICFAVLISCNNDSTTYSVGEDFIDLNTRVTVTDTLSVITSTVLFDSIVTSSSSRLLLGALQDSDFGNLTSQSFMNLTTSDYDIEKDAVYDSIGVILYYDRYYYGDTTTVQTYKVHEIIENFEPKNDDNDDDNFYNTSSLNYSDEVLGEITFKPFPNKKDSIYIPIKKTFGNSIFEKFQNNDVNNYDDLYQVFKGITIVPANNSNNVIGFGKASMVMRIYYNIENEDDEDSDYYKDLTIESSYRFFNKITSDRSSTLLATIPGSEDFLLSTKTNYQAYIQSGTSLNMRIEIPYIKNLNSLEQNGTALNAILKFYPNIKSYQSNAIGADSIAVYVVDHKNRFIKQLTGFDGQAIYAKYNTQNDEFDSKNYFTADITYFLEEIQSSSYNLNYALLFQFPNNNNSVNKILIYDSVNSVNKMKVTLTYLLY